MEQGNPTLAAKNAARMGHPQSHPNVAKGATLGWGTRATLSDGKVNNSGVAAVTGKGRGRG